MVDERSSPSTGWKGVRKRMTGSQNSETETTETPDLSEYAAERRKKQWEEHAKKEYNGAWAKAKICEALESYRDETEETWILHHNGQHLRPVAVIDQEEGTVVVDQDYHWEDAHMAFEKEDERIEMNAGLAIERSNTLGLDNEFGNINRMPRVDVSEYTDKTDDSHISGSFYSPDLTEFYVEQVKDRVSAGQNIS